MRSTLESSAEIPAMPRRKRAGISSAFHALTGAPNSAAPVRDRRIYRLTLPDPAPIAVLIIVLALQQNGSPAVTAEVPRFVTLARLHSDASSTTAPPGAPVRFLGRLSREEDGLPTPLGSAPWWSCWACGAGCCRPPRRACQQRWLSHRFGRARSRTCRRRGLVRPRRAPHAKSYRSGLASGPGH